MRYVPVLLLLSAVLFAPYLWLALHTPPPADAAQVRTMARMAWVSLAYVGAIQLLLVGPAAVATGSQLRALATGIRQLVRAAVPCLVAIAAVALGGLALALPGVLLLALFSLTAASTEPGVPGPLLDSAAVVRRNAVRVAITIAAIALVDAGIVFAWQHFVIVAPVAKQPITPAELAWAARSLRYVAIAFATVSPVVALALAAIRVTDRRRGAAPPRAASSSATASPPAAAAPHP